jgi:hydroxyacylglutathione hydrolase
MFTLLALLALLPSPALAGDACAPDGGVEAVQIGFNFVNVWALIGESGIVLIDAHNPGEEDKVLDKLSKAGITASEVTLIVLTHGHGDHAGSALALKEALDVPVAVQALDVPAVEAGEPLVPLPYTDWRGRALIPFLHHEYDPFSPDLVIQDSLDLSRWGVDAEVRWVGGHTPGSVIVDLKDGRVLVGDLIRGKMQNPDKPTLHFFQEDLPTAHARLRELAGSQRCLMPAHGDPLEAAEVLEWLDRYEGR